VAFESQPFLLAADARWASGRREVDWLTDHLGRPVDPGIKLAVTGLRANGFPTSGSCEGHLKRALPYPWIHLCATHAVGCRGTPEREARSRAANIALLGLIDQLLAEFYDRRLDERGMRLVARTFGPVHAVAVHSRGATTASDHARDRAAQLRASRREMDTFADWLRCRFLGGPGIPT
jgi:hypothetical protein